MDFGSIYEEVAESEVFGVSVVRGGVLGAAWGRLPGSGAPYSSRREVCIKPCFDRPQGLAVALQFLEQRLGVGLELPGPFELLLKFGVGHSALFNKDNSVAGVVSRLIRIRIWR